MSNSNINWRKIKHVVIILTQEKRSIQYRSGISGDSNNDEHEKECSDKLDRNGLPGANGRHGGAAGHERMKNGLEAESGGNGSGNLSGDVERNVNPWKVTESGEGYGDWGVQMSAWDVADGQDYGHHRQSGADRTR